MKKVIAISSIVLALAAQQIIAAETPASAAATSAKPAARPYNYKTPKLSRAQFDALLGHPDSLLLIDVRRPDELTKIGGFPAYLSIQSSDLEKYVAYIPKDREIVTVSNHAGRAGAAADLLAGKGFRVVGAVGAENYEEEGGKLTKIEPKPIPVTTAEAEHH